MGLTSHDGWCRYCGSAGDVHDPSLHPKPRKRTGPNHPAPMGRTSPDGARLPQGKGSAGATIDIRLVLDDDHQVQVVRSALKDGRRALADSIATLYKAPVMDTAKYARYKAGREALDVLLARFDDAVAEARA